ncbi:ATP-binding protein [Geothrix sp. 21YS21S-4]|uniref:sensor histidine kinase n=1 Tax=Geothrix sp. 21YS21S-4 TaxID=3068889 RepID=UPI0027B92C44|nr:ATP-binding protein [Geothrix sp. 21YS21S-4]
MQPLRSFLLGFLLVGGMGMGAELPGPAEAGDPIIRNYSPKLYGADAQNWAILQDPRGVVYAGNNRGVLEYDGARWRLIPTLRKTVVRSLGMDSTGRVYVGGVGEIGYLAPDERGAARFVSLNDRLPEAARAFSDVWVTAVTPQGVLFQTREALFLLRGEEVQVVKASTTFHVAFAVQGRIFVRQREVGLQELRDGRLSSVPGGERFARESLFAMLPLGAPGDGAGILLASRSAGLWKLTSSGISRFPTPAEAYLNAHAVYHGVRLREGTLALATIKGGVVLLDGRGRVHGLLDRQAGLDSDNVKAICAGRDAALWLALDNGLSRVEWPSPLTVFDHRSGLKGTVWAVQDFGGRLYVATGQGAFVLEEPAAEGFHPRPRFAPLPGVTTQSLAFLPGKRSLLLGTAQGVFEVRGSQARLIRRSSNVAISFLRSRLDPSRVFLGLQGELASLRESGDGWQEEGRIAGVEDDVYSLVEDERGRLWLGTGSQGLLRLTFGEGWRGGSTAPVRVERFGTAEGLPNLLQPFVFRWRGEILAATAAGILAFDEAGGRFRPAPWFARLFPDGPRAVKAARVDALDRLWMDTRDEARGLHEAGVAVAGAEGTLAWEAAPYRRLGDTSVESIHVDPRGVVWFGGSEGALRFDPARADRHGRAGQVLIRRVSRADGEIYGGDGPLSATPEEGPALPHRTGALRFEFASPSFDAESANQYQVRLDGYDPDWSPWTFEAQKEYTNLPEGRYRFQVRARNVYGQVSPEQSFGFRALPPWYRTAWARALFAGLALLAAGLAVRVWTALLRRRNRTLQRWIALAVEDLRDRERMLADQAGALERANAQLVEINEQKNHFLAMVAHDLRNPLHSILVNSEFLAEEGGPDVRRRAGMIAQEGANMNLLIGRFLDISALDSGRIRNEPGHLSIPALLEGLLQRHGPAAEAKSIALRVTADPQGGRVFADAKFVTAILDNLLSNAIKFSPLRTAVDICVEDGEETVRIAVQDQGPGLTEADQKRAFGRFVRLSARPTGGEKSVGLGLSIAKQMAELCKGSIRVESEPGKGATFLVELPRAKE